MPVLSGAIAYRASLIEKVAEQIVSWQKERDYDREAGTKRVLCPKCGEPYILVEGIDTSDDLIQDDQDFLAKALSTGHPSHPTQMVIRDPDDLLSHSQFTLPAQP